MGVTDDWYTDGRVPSVRPSICFSPTNFIVVTDGISPSVKLDNVVVIWLLNFSYIFCCYPIFDPCFDKFSEKIQK
jgi:hypothetical protein